MTFIKGYREEAESIFAADDGCCYDPDNDTVILGAAGFRNPFSYFNKSTFIYV